MKTFQSHLVAFLALVGAMVVGGAQVVRAQDGTIQLQGNVLQVGSGDGQSKVFVLTTDGVQSSESSDKADAGPEKATYWVGILGGPVPPELRAQIDIPAGQGLLVRQIVPESPAVKAGLKEYDILLRGNDSDLKQMRDLAELVRTVGPKKATITLEVLRQGKRQSIDITPVERSAPPAGMKPEAGSGQGSMLPGNQPLKQLTELKEKSNAGGGSASMVNEGQMLRFFGPGVVLSQSTDVAGIPGGVSVSIDRKENQPPHITVKRGDQTWEATGDNLESLNQIPEDVRPFVTKMLNSAMSNPPMGAGGMPGMPQPMQLPNMPRMGGMADAEKRMQERLDQMEQHLKELEERMHNASGTNSPDSAK